MNNFEGWAIVELMGHVRLAGYVTEEEHFGAKLGRIDIPFEGGPATQYFAGSAVYRVTPCTEIVARTQVSRVSKPVSEWDLQHILDRGPKLLEANPIPMSPDNFSEEECEDADDEIVF